MSNLTAIVPVASIAATNKALQDAGFGPSNFSVPAYTGLSPTFAAMHAWGDPVFAAAVKALPGVVFDETDGDPITLTAALIAAQGAQWGAQAPALPSTGNVTAGKLYTWTDGTLWSVIQTFSRTTYGADPSTYPALIRRVHVPGELQPWKQPIDQYDAYKLVNPFNGQPDQCTYGGFSWYVTAGDGAGNNTYQPGVYGWTKR